MFSNQRTVNANNLNILTKNEVILGQLSVADFLVQKTAGVQVSICHEAGVCELLTHLTGGIKNIHGSATNTSECHRKYWFALI